MANRFFTGYTYSIFCSFFDTSGARTSVDSPVVDIYTPQKTKYVDAGSLSTTSTTGKYQYNLFCPSGMTVGSWLALGIGSSNSNTLFSEITPFEVVDMTLEPAFVGLEEFRNFLGLSDTENRTEDTSLKQALQAAVELVEGYTNRHYGLFRYDETIEVKDSDRIKLKAFPVNSIVAITATVEMIPRTIDNLTTESLTGTQVSFYYRMDMDNGIIHLTDSAGFDDTYDGVLVAIAYWAGFATVPEPVRQAVLSLASSLRSLSITEGIASVRMGSMSFAMQKGLFEGQVGVLLSPYKNNYQV